MSLDAFISLHWLRVPERIRSKVAVLVYSTRCSTAVRRRTLARSLTLPTFQVAEGFALPCSDCLVQPLVHRSTVGIAGHFRFLALRCGTACHRRLRRHRFWRISSLDSKTFLFTDSCPDIRLIWYFCVYTLSRYFKHSGHSKNSWLIDWLMCDEHNRGLVCCRRILVRRCAHPGSGRQRTCNLAPSQRSLRCLPRRNQVARLPSFPIKHLITSYLQRVCTVRYDQVTQEVTLTVILSTIVTSAMVEVHNTVSQKKTRHSTHVDNFVKYWSIFTILSLLD